MSGLEIESCLDEILAAIVVTSAIWVCILVVWSLILLKCKKQGKFMSKRRKNMVSIQNRSISENMTSVIDTQPLPQTKKLRSISEEYDQPRRPAKLRTASEERQERQDRQVPPPAKVLSVSLQRKHLQSPVSSPSLGLPIHRAPSPKPLQLAVSLQYPQSPLSSPSPGPPMDDMNELPKLNLVGSTTVDSNNSDGDIVIKYNGKHGSNLMAGNGNGSDNGNVNNSNGDSSARMINGNNSDKHSEWLQDCEIITLLKDTIINHNNNAEFSTHCIFEEYNSDLDFGWYYCKPNLKYPRIKDISLALSDNINDNPVWKQFINNKFDQMSLYYLGDGVTFPEDDKGINHNHNDTTTTQRQMFVVSVPALKKVDPNKVLQLTERTRQKMLVTDSVCQMVTCSIYYVPIKRSLGNSTVIVACMNGFNYTDFTPIKNSMLAYSSGNSGRSPIRGLWHGLVYEPPIATEDNNNHMLNSVGSNNNDNDNKNNNDSDNNNNSEIEYADSVMISMYPTRMTEKLSTALGIAGNFFFVETMGNLGTICRALILASKLKVKHLALFGQPLAVAHAIWYWRHKMGYQHNNNENHTKISLIVGGYLTPKNLLSFMKETLDLDDISMDCYYGTTDFVAGCMKCETNDVNGYKISNNKLGAKDYRGKLYLSNEDTTICTNDKVIVQYDDDDPIYYFKYKNDCEEWIVEHWTSHYFKYLTGNMALGKNIEDERILYLQCREKHVTALQKLSIRKTIERDEFYEKLLLNQGIDEVILLEYSNFESLFAVNLVQQKPLYRKFKMQLL